MQPPEMKNGESWRATQSTRSRLVRTEITLPRAAPTRPHECSKPTRKEKKIGEFRKRTEASTRFRLVRTGDTLLSVVRIKLLECSKLPPVRSSGGSCTRTL